MRVYVKKEDKDEIIPGIIVMIIFLSVSVGIFYAFFNSEKSFGEALASFGITLIFAIIFLGFSIYFIYFLIKRPRAYKAKLIDKKMKYIMVKK